MKTVIGKWGKPQIKDWTEAIKQKLLSVLLSTIIKSGIMKIFILGTLNHEGKHQQTIAIKR